VHVAPHVVVACTNARHGPLQLLVMPLTHAKIARIPAAEFKKPLKVKFRGEEGIDEGGVRKEFFQVLLRDLFDKRYGEFASVSAGSALRRLLSDDVLPSPAMFVFDEDTHFMWFNGASLEANVQFELVGIVSAMCAMAHVGWH